MHRRLEPRTAHASESDTTRIGWRRADRCGWAGSTFRTIAQLVGHSDADVLLHAVTDALLGAAALGDIGEMFPDTDPPTAAATRPRCCEPPGDRSRRRGFRIVNLDCIVFAQRPKLSPYKDAIRQRIAELLGMPPDQRRPEGQDRRSASAPSAARKRSWPQCVVLLETNRRLRSDATTSQTGSNRRC